MGERFIRYRHIEKRAEWIPSFSDVKHKEPFWRAARANLLDMTIEDFNSVIAVVKAPIEQPAPYEPLDHVDEAISRRDGSTEPWGER